MALTTEQKTALLAAARPNAGHREAARLLNSELVGGTVVKEEKALYPVPEILASLSDDSVCNLLDFFEQTTNQAKAFKYRWDSLENMDMAHAVTRASINALVTGSVITQDEANALLAIGERQKTKADELLGRLATAADIEEARS